MSDNCPSAVPCPCDSLADTPYDGSAPQVKTYVATGFAAVVPALGQSWDRLSCMMFSSSPVSQEAADFTAQQQAQLCALSAVSPYSPETGPGGGGSGGGGGGGSGLVFFNSPQECTVTCPDGLPFTYQVPAGAFSGTTQAAADIAAQSFACAQASQRIVCLSDLDSTTAFIPGSGYAGPSYTGTITATGGNLAGPGQTNLWEITGSVPAGLTFNGGALASNQVTITGTATTLGSYTFTVKLTTPNGDVMSKNYTIIVVQINTFYGQPPLLVHPNGYRTHGGDRCNGGSGAVDANGSFNLFTPSAPYTFGFLANLTFDGFQQVMDFRILSGSNVTWFWRYRGHTGSSGGVGNEVQLRYMPANFVCPGTPQNPVIDSNGDWSITGTFTTTPGAGFFDIEFIAGVYNTPTGFAAFEIYAIPTP